MSTVLGAIKWNYTVLARSSVMHEKYLLRYLIKCYDRFLFGKYGAENKICKNPAKNSFLDVPHLLIFHGV